MELLYVWVEKYGNIRKQGFNFSPNYDFEVKEENGEYILVDNFETSGKKKQPEKFFGENISNITAIVGKNRSGKSTLLNFITEERLPKIEKYILTGNKLITPKYNSLFIYKNEKEILYRISRKSSEFNIKVDGAENMEDKEVNKNEKMPYAIYFDNIFNPFKTYHGDKTHGKIFDISTSYEFFHNNSGDRLMYYSNETKNQINCFKNSYNNIFFNKAEIRKPKKIIIENVSDCYDENFIVKEVDEFINQFIRNLMYIYYVQYKDIVDDKEGSEEFIKEEKDKDKFKKTISKENYQEFINYIKDKHKETTYEVNLSNFEKIIEAFYMLISNISKKTNYSKGSLEIELSDENIEQLTIFLEEVKKNSIKRHFFKYEYDVQYSSGEKAVLTLYSRLISLLEKTKEDIILLLDEPEVFAHPEWQREFIFYLTNFIKLVYKDKKVQIILTSHSPFVASDLPRENVIMLDVYGEKDKETKKDEKTKESEQEIGNCKVVKDKNIKTFGANIFDLYTEAFFVESSFGEFAKGKIKEVVDWLKYTEDEKTKKRTYINEDKINKEQIEYILNSIGEPLVKNKLQKMYDEYRENGKYKNSEEYKKEKLKELKKSLGLSKKELQQLIKNGDLND